MERVAVIEIKTTSVNLSIVDVVRNKYFETGKVMKMPINLIKDFYDDMFIKPTVIKEINSILEVYKKIIEQYDCTESICIASEIVADAKNQNGFLNELYVVSGFKFEVINHDQDAMDVYTSVINSFNRPKGMIISINDFYSQVIAYNRRNILNKVTIPYGRINFYNDFKDISFEERQKKINKIAGDIIDSNEIIYALPDEYDLVGVGDVFKDFGVVCRKARKYPLELSHNFIASFTDFDKVYNLMKNVDINNSTKIKGISLQDSKYFPFGMQIIKAILSKFVENYEFAISKLSRIDGILFNKIIPLTIEKPISDTLGYSLQVVNDFYDKKPNNSQNVYDISMMLFKQLKVLHKLPRAYLKVLRIASYLSSSGNRVDPENAENFVYEVIRNCTLFGTNHEEIILAGFVAQCKNADNFNLSEWVRYKEYLDDEDLQAVKKLSVILKVAEALDVTGFGVVQDITCDILGDSVIMKTIVDGDASFEISNAMLCSSDFKKAFGKNLEVL